MNHCVNYVIINRMCRSITIFKIPYSYNSIGEIDSEKDQFENFSASGADYFHTTDTKLTFRALALVIAKTKT